MKTIVKAITVLAFLLIFFGGAAMDSENIIIPVMIVAPGLGWLGLVAWVNTKPRKETK